MACVAAGTCVNMFNQFSPVKQIHLAESLILSHAPLRELPGVVLHYGDSWLLVRAAGCGLP